MNRDKRTYGLFTLISILCFILILRLFYIQILKGEFYLKKAQTQRVNFALDKKRGDIFDRNGEALTGSYYESYAIISPQWLSESERKRLSDKGLLSSIDTKKPQNIKITKENFDEINSLKGRSPGIYLYKKKVLYGPSALATHVVGYKNETGIERSYDNVLKVFENEDGIVIDGFGQPIAGIEYNENQKKFGIELTIDKNIQSAVEEIMDEKIKKGAVVVADTRTGEILAMASRPNYKQYQLEKYLTRQDAPLINRAVEGFSPGSIFKIIILSAALEEGITNLDEKFYCPGFIKVGGNIFKCESYDKGGHGEITLREAMAKSCNTVFIQLGLRLGKEKIIEYARKFGLGQKVGIDLPEEKPGFIPDCDKMYFQDIGNIAIGQGPIQVTPLQATQVVLTIANNGILVKPHLVKEIIKYDGTVVPSHPNSEHTRIISEKTAEDVKTTLEEVTKYGTGVNANPTSISGKSAGKTGTAEVSKDIFHAWFIGYYPASSPRFAMSVFLEEGGYGPTKAAPVFKEIVERLNLIN